MYEALSARHWLQGTAWADWSPATKKFCKGLGMSTDCDSAKIFTVESHQRAVSGVAQGVRFLQDRIEHREEVAGRRIDDLQYFGSPGLLITRFSKFSLTLGKLTLQIGYKLLGIG